MADKIKTHLEKQTLDIRKLGIKTCFDQKGKIDVVSFLAECVLELIKDDDTKEFGTTDIWEMEYFEQNVPEFFNKPKPSDPDASNEYDKFVSQPILVFFFSGLLAGRKNGKWKFCCKNKELLDYISRNPRHAHEFLAKYYEKIFRDSGLGSTLDNFMRNQNQQSLEQLRDEFYCLLLHNTPMGSKGASGDNPGKLEAMRIFNPVLNVICAKHGVEGTESGNVSGHVIRYDELQYNRINFRDKFKKKELTRSQAEKVKEIEISSKKYFQHQERKARKEIDEKYGKNPMFLDEYHKCTAAEVHHIVLKADKEQFRGYPENLINLSPTQHRNLAHGKGTGVSTKQAEPTYQRKLLIANSFYIEKSLQGNENLYSKEQFIELLQEGLEIKVYETDTFDEIRKKIADGFFEQNKIDEIKNILIS